MNKSPTVPTAATSVIRAKAFSAEELSDLHGHFRDGYTGDDVNWAFGLLRRVTGVELCVVWGYVDIFGFGGDSDFAVLVNGEPHVIESGTSDLDDFMRGECADVPSTLEIVAGARIKTESGQGYNFPMVDRTA